MPKFDTLTVGLERVFVRGGDNSLRSTVKNLGPGTVYYGAATVSASSNTGSILSGASAAVELGVWFVSASQSRIVMSTQDAKEVLAAGLGVVYADPNVPDGSTDNTAYLTALNVTAIATGAKLRIPDGNHGDWVVQEWTLPSYSNIDATGATFKLPSGVRKRLVMNTAQTLATPGSTRDNSITVTGGTWDQGAFTGVITHDINCMGLCFAFLDKLTIRDITVRNTGTVQGGVYGVYGWMLTDFLVDGVDGNPSVVSAIIQFTQCSKGMIRRITGTSGDDSVAVLARDLANNEFGGVGTYGDVHHVEVEHIYVTSGVNGVRILSGTNDAASVVYKARDITVKHVEGSFNGVATSGGGVCVGGFENTALMTLRAGTCEDITVENVLTTNGSYAVRVQGGGTNQTIRGITLRNCRTSSTTAASILLGADQIMSDIEVCDTNFVFTAAAYAIVNNTAAVRNLKLRNLRVVGPTTGGPYNAGLLQVATTGGATICTVSACSCSGKVYSIGEIASTTRFNIIGLLGEDANHQGWLRLLTGAVVTIKGAGMTYGGAVEDVTIVAGTLTSEAQAFKVDVNSLQRNVNGACFNTNAARSCGLGPVVCDGTTWKHLYTAATF